MASVAAVRMNPFGGVPDLPDRIFMASPFGVYKSTSILLIA
jgi:hypothetical protein